MYGTQSIALPVRTKCPVLAWRVVAVWIQQFLTKVNVGQNMASHVGHQLAVLQKFWRRPAKASVISPNILQTNKTKCKI